MLITMKLFARIIFPFATLLLILSGSTWADEKKPNILVIWGDDIGWSNLSSYNHAVMGYRTPNIDRIAHEGAMFTDHYAQPSCTAGRAAFITGQYPIRSGMTTVGQPGDALGLQKESPSLAEVLKAEGYRTGHFGKNHLGDRNEHLPTVHGFDEFFGNLYHLNAEDEPENPDYPKDPEFKKKFGPRESSTISPAPSRVHSNSAQTISYLMPSGSLKKSA
jgi:arylsulfatase A-like enzyme